MPTIPATAPSSNGVPQTFQRAELQVGPDTIQCLFNPASYEISKTNNYNFKEITGSALPPAEFAGGQPRELKLDLLLDVSLLGEGNSVREVTDKLFKAMEIPAGRASNDPNAVPPFMTFRWGSVVTFKAVCTSLKVQFNLFHPNGEPIRADVTMQLKQAQHATSRSAQSANKKQNPTTRANAGMGVHVVKDGDSLQSIAFRTYRDPSRWRDIAHANGIDNPFHLRRGAALSLPKL
jgi:hypothetical protein